MAVFRLECSEDEERQVNFPSKEASLQGRSKVFTTGQARFNPEHYVIKCVGVR